MRKLLNILRSRLRRYQQKKYEKSLTESLSVNGINIFERFHLAMESVQCDYWLAFGTLLGAIRDNNFISYDTDIDVGVSIDTDFDKVESALRQFGFKKMRKIELYTTGNCQERGFELTFIQDNILIDIFVFDKIPGTNRIYTHTCLWDNDHFQYLSTVLRVITPFTGISKYNFLGIDVNVPSNYDEYLKAYYGEEYNKPDSNWTPRMSPAVEVVKDAIGILIPY